MKIEKINAFYVIKNFSHHNKIKKNLLEIINKSEYNNPVSSKSEVNISRADWFKSQDMSREWVQYLKDFLIEDLIEINKKIGFDGFKINEIWFQQYYKGSQHGWHTHSSNFTNVYYLELPKNSPNTLLIDPYDRKKIIEIDAKEGDLLMFPSYILHKAPINLGDRKTIISYNLDSTYSDNIYERRQ